MEMLTMDEVGLVSGGMPKGVVDILGGVIGAGGGVSAVGAGLAMETGLAAGLVIGGGALAVAGGVALIGYGIYEAVED